MKTTILRGPDGEEENDEEREAIIAESEIPADQTGLPKFGQVTQKSKGRMQAKYESGLDKMIAKAKKPRQKTASKKQDLASELTESVDNGSMRDRESETRNTTIQREQEEDITMAAKKKTAKKVTKKSAAKKSDKKVQTAEPIGRTRKLLLRLSVEEYANLEAKAAKLNTSMANHLRTSAGI